MRLNVTIGLTIVGHKLVSPVFMCAVLYYVHVSLDRSARHTVLSTVNGLRFARLLVGDC